MTRADIESIEKQDIRRRYAGKQAPRANRKKLTATTVMDGKGLMKLESEQQEKELLQAVRSAGGGEGKAKAKEPTKRKVCKGRREDPIKVDDLESDREWDDIEAEVVPLAAGRTLGMTLRPRRGGGDGRGSNDGFGSDQGIWPIKDSDFWVLRHLGFLFMMW